MNAYFAVIVTLFLTVYGQLILKWRILKYGSLPEELKPKILFLFKLFLDPYILSGFFAALLASVLWMAAMTKLELSKAYPVMSLAPALVFFLSILFLNESYSHGKLVGLLLIGLGVIVTFKF
ncbi:membrane protein [Roseivirga seohaensis subsp. aquiponti]|uniref:Membrane protein n=1 Tax=Roseivirga seohaensis subsp. aquiponti TaxID=1566026 RepID=A0A0L8ALB7_9BACT|nr:EamA family transporter [Roseivirga seohaensis]KOF03263.1 membrane protein [Roseivirga seohaensis subsp. aquiponti]